MKHDPLSMVNRKKAKTVLRLPDLEFAKTAVPSSLTSVDAQRGYRHAIVERLDGKIRHAIANGLLVSRSIGSRGERYCADYVDRNQPAASAYRH